MASPAPPVRRRWRPARSAQHAGVVQQLLPIHFALRNAQPMTKNSSVRSTASSSPNDSMTPPRLHRLWRQGKPANWLHPCVAGLVPMHRLHGRGALSLHTSAPVDGAPKQSRFRRKRLCSGVGVGEGARRQLGAQSRARAQDAGAAHFSLRHVHHAVRRDHSTARSEATASAPASVTWASPRSNVRLRVRRL